VSGLSENDIGGTSALAHGRPASGLKAVSQNVKKYRNFASAPEAETQHRPQHRPSLFESIGRNDGRAPIRVYTLPKKIDQLRMMSL
jgi:hypothetical protein